MSHSTNISSFYRRLCKARWWSISLAALIALLAPSALGLNIPELPVFAILVTLLLINGLTVWRLQKQDAPEETGFLLALSTDLAALSALLFFTGGATNPLISLMLPLVAVAALTLSPFYAGLFATLAILGYSVLMQYFVPLALTDAARATQLHLAGMWLTFVISTALISLLVLRMMTRIREGDAALATAREQALREERVVAMGALAAGAAHALGTPLATMTLIAGELEHETTLSAAGRDDLLTLRQQLEVCKRTLTELTERAGADRCEAVRVQALDIWLSDLRIQWQNKRPRGQLQLRLPDGPAPSVAVPQTLEQAVINLLDNAERMTRTTVSLEASWAGSGWAVEVRDDGPGFNHDALARAGHAPFPAHAQGNGVGLMLSAAAVQRLGGTLKLYNHEHGGAAARIEFTHV